MQVKKKRKRGYAASIGGIFLALAVIGAISVIVASITLTQKVLDNSNERSKLEEIIRPVMMFNPVPFENPVDIPEKQLLLYSMWVNLLGEKRASYTFDENIEMIVPASDLDVAATRLFGPDVALTHQTFDDYQTTYYYDGELEQYLVPVNAQLYVYTPQVESIEREQGDLYDVLVSYLPPVNAWTVDFSGNRGTPNPEKQMIYVMKKTKNTYQITALRDLPSEPVAETPAPAVSESVSANTQ